MSEKTLIEVEGMTCVNCAKNIERKLKKIGIDDANVNFASEEVSLTLHDKTLAEITDTIESLGFSVKNQGAKKKRLSIVQRFYLCLAFTLPLFLAMFFPKETWIHNPTVQLTLCIPVLIIGGTYFFKSGYHAVKSSTANMDVLISIGSLSAFFYSIWGWITATESVHKYLFFETSATIITLVLLGNLLEHLSVKKTTTALKELNQLAPEEATKVFADGTVTKILSKDLLKNDLIRVNTGDKIPSDANIVSGNANINESMLSGESLPVVKNIGDPVYGGTLVVSGSIDARITETTKTNALAKIIDLVKQAENRKPVIQKLGDQVSAIFVPVVIGISLLTFLLNFFVFDIPLNASIMRSIAVLVISCPCAMGLATPTAVMVGIGRAAKKGILIKGGDTLEKLAKTQHIIFDKTGTITTGDFKITQFKNYSTISDEQIYQTIREIETHSSHPIAKALAKKIIPNPSLNSSFHNIEEIKGAGMKAQNELGENYLIGSAAHTFPYSSGYTHDIYIVKDAQLIAGLSIHDTIKEDAKSTVQAFITHGFKTLLLSGDKEGKCITVAQETTIEQVAASQSPAQKLRYIKELEKSTKSIMVGDGINDAPALAVASVGISLSNATQIAINSAQVIVLNGHKLQGILTSYLIGKHTLITIKQNLFWAFFYNVVAIPIAAFGYLDPMVAALTMAFSDVIVIGNSIRLKTKKLK